MIHQTVDRIWGLTKAGCCLIGRSRSPTNVAQQLFQPQAHAQLKNKRAIQTERPINTRKLHQYVPLKQYSHKILGHLITVVKVFRLFGEFCALFPYFWSSHWSRLIFKLFGAFCVLFPHKAASFLSLISNKMK